MFIASKVIKMVLALAVVPCSAQSNLLQITSPASGTVVFPGQVVIISVGADPSVSNIAILAQDPLGFSQATNGQPLQFQLSIPSNTTIGSYDVSALGTAADGSGVASPSISLQGQPEYAVPNTTNASVSAAVFGSRGNDPPPRSGYLTTRCNSLRPNQLFV